jgi:hypothetical protein
MISNTLKEILTEIKSLNIHLYQQNNSWPLIISVIAIIISLFAVFLEFRKHKSNIKVYTSLTKEAGSKKKDHFLNIILINLSYRPSTIVNVFLLDRRNLSPFDRILQYIPKPTDIDLPLAVGSWATVKFKIYLSNYLNHDVILIDMDKKAYIIDQKSLKCKKTSANSIEGNLYFRFQKCLYKFKVKIFRFFKIKSPGVNRHIK